MARINFKEKLIGIFAKNSLQAIEADGCALLIKQLGAGCRSLVENETYAKYYTLLKGPRQDLDETLAGTRGSLQARECLKLLDDYKENESDETFELLGQLIRQGPYALEWEEVTRKIYDTGWAMLSQWADFFFSYTNRNLNETNSQFSKILRDALGKETFKAYREKLNCVARLIVSYLDANNLTAFYDIDHMTCGDVIEKKILDHCRSAFTFVQLVEARTFEYRRGRTNWCYREFEEFNTCCGEKSWFDVDDTEPCKRFFFILVGRHVFPANFPGKYRDWKAKIEESLNIQYLCELSHQQIRAAVWELARQIVTARKRILEDYFG